MHFQVEWKSEQISCNMKIDDLLFVAEYLTLIQCTPVD